MVQSGYFDDFTYFIEEINNNDFNNSIDME